LGPLQKFSSPRWLIPPEDTYEPDSDIEVGPPPPPAEVGERRKAGVQWGTGVWRLAVLRRETGEAYACGARCNGHVNADNARVCKKFVTIGSSGLSVEVITLRLKRWLVAGLDSDDWRGDDLQRQHVDLGGQHLRDFANGLTEAACDRIANAQ